MGRYRLGLYIQVTLTNVLGALLHKGLSLDYYLCMISQFRMSCKNLPRLKKNVNKIATYLTLSVFPPNISEKERMDAIGR